MSTTFKTVLATIGVIVLLALGVTALGIYQVRADGGACAIKVDSQCLLDVVNELRVIAGLPVEEIDFEAGAVVGPENTFLDTVDNGVPIRHYGSRFAQGTTTVWRSQTPNATTTPSILCYVDVASTSATVWTLAISTGGFPTTTSYLDVQVAASAKATFGFTSTSTSGTNAEALQIAPGSTWILSVQGLIDGTTETAGTNAPGAIPVGYCSSEHSSFNVF